MRRGTSVILFAFGIASVVVVAWAQEDEFSQGPQQQPPRKVIKSEREWAKKLTRAQFVVTRMKVTEPPFSGKLLNNHAKGTYTCVGCDAKLFSSQAKFNSGTGWPSFWRPYSAQSLATEPDYSNPEPRVEVLCSTCGAHLGHVFSDGPPPTGLRYCINSLALKFVKPEKPASDDEKTKSASDEAKNEEPKEKSPEKTEAKPGSKSAPKRKIRKR